MDQRDLLIYIIVDIYIYLYWYLYNINNYNNLNSRINLLVNKVNWNILVTLGKEIKRDSI